MSPKKSDVDVGTGETAPEPAKKAAAPRKKAATTVVEPLPPPPAVDDPPSRTPLFVAAGLAVAFFLTTVVLLVVSAQLKSDRDDVSGERQDVAVVSGQFVEAFVSFDYRDPQTQHDTVMSMSAPPFTDQFEQAFQQLQQLFQETQSSATATVKDVFIGEITPDGTASAIVVYDRVVESATASTPEVNVYVRLDLVKLNGQWRVSGVINLNFALSGPAVPSDGVTPQPAG